MSTESYNTNLNQQYLVELTEGYHDFLVSGTNDGEIEFRKLQSDGNYWARASFKNGRLQKIIFVEPVYKIEELNLVKWHRLVNIPEFGLQQTTIIDTDLVDQPRLVINDFTEPDPAIIEKMLEVISLADERVGTSQSYMPINLEAYKKIKKRGRPDINLQNIFKAAGRLTGVYCALFVNPAAVFYDKQRKQK